MQRDTRNALANNVSTDRLAPTESGSRSRRALAAVALGGVAIASVLVGCKPAAPNPHKCDKEVVMLGDSRIRREGSEIPRTSNEIVGRTLGVVGKDTPEGKEYAKFIAKDGSVHSDLAAQLKAFSSACSAKERPLLIDFMGANYVGGYVTRPSDQTREEFQQDLGVEIDTFYKTNASGAKVVLNEFFFGIEEVTDEGQKAAAKDFEDMYNGTLQQLAQAQPGRYFYQPKPKVVVDGKIEFRDGDAFHFSNYSISDLLASQAVELDNRAMAVIADNNSSCSIFTSMPEFSAANNSESRYVSAAGSQLNPLGNPAFSSWLTKDLDAKAMPVDYRVGFNSGYKEDCTPDF